MTTRSPNPVESPLPRRLRAAVAGLALLACLGAGPGGAERAGGTDAALPRTLDALAGPPSNRFT